MKKENLMHKTYNRLTVIQESNNIGKYSAWLCQCTCGNIKAVKSQDLKDGSTKSCGCLNNEKRTTRAPEMYSTLIKYDPQHAAARRIYQKRYADGDLDIETFKILSKMNCYYCDGEPNNIFSFGTDDKKASKNKIKEGKYIYNGLDRIDSSLPHNKENVVACCKHCNYAKRDRTFLEFKLWAEKLYFNLKTK